MVPHASSQCSRSRTVVVALLAAPQRPSLDRRWVGDLDDSIDVQTDSPSYFCKIREGATYYGLETHCAAEFATMHRLQVDNNRDDGLEEPKKVRGMSRPSKRQFHQTKPHWHSEGD